MLIYSAPVSWVQDLDSKETSTPAVTHSLIWVPVFQQGNMFSTGEVKVVISIMNKLTPVTEEGKVSPKTARNSSYSTMVCTA